MRLIIAAVANFALLGPALALDLQTFQRLMAESRDSRESLELYIMGVGEGFSWSSAILAVERSRPLYCPPGNSRLGANDYMRILANRISRTKVSDKAAKSVELILYYGLVDAYLCEEK